MDKGVNKYINKVSKWYFSREALPYWCTCVMDLTVVFLSMLAMHVILYSRLSGAVSSGMPLVWSLGIYSLLYLVGFRLFHTYTDVFRVMDAQGLLRTAYASLVGSALCVLVRFLSGKFGWGIEMVPYRVFVMTFICSTVVMGGLRLLAKTLFEIGHSKANTEVELLPRQEIDVDLERIGAQLYQKKILVTGAAGSIGSEMVRQIAEFKPAKLILVDQAETPMHDLMLEVRKEWGFIDTKFIIATIINKERMEVIFHKYKPDYVFHAAAYKHVPMMEENPSVSVLNNIYGTRVLADLSVKYKVKKFVMVSTDKAVNPTNVMGCSKRICEIYVQSLDKALRKKQAEASAENNGQASAKPYTPTQFITTRFGNVLGSNGSVIPLFKKQIEMGGPVTVTHPDIIRYFMLIPEACKLVLEAGTMGNGGEVFVFDMGEPVKIVDLAKKMIHNSGHHEIKIQFTGLREGEKLYEEVLFNGEEELPTDNPKIRTAKVREYDYDDVCVQIDKLMEISHTYDEMMIVKQMKAIVPEFISNNSKYEALDPNEDDA